MKSVTLLAAALAAFADAMPDPFVPAIELHDGKVGRVGRVARAAAPPKGEEQPITTPVLDTPTVQGCFKSSGDLKFNTTIKWNTIGECATNVCYKAGFAVGGSTGGNQCWCGNTYPPKDDLVEDSECNVPCPGYGDHACKWLRSSHHRGAESADSGH
jgi:cell wall integrity and stress response component